MKIHIDFETQSRLELPDVGADRYSEHESTDAVCLAYAIGDETVKLWQRGGMGPKELFEAIANPENVVLAHNAAFELAIWNRIMVPRYNWPALNYKNTRCTMAAAYAMSLPGSLDKLALALKVKENKDKEGRKAMLTICKPDKTGKLLQHKDNPELFEKLYLYCKQDVRTERECAKFLMPLSQYEQKVWQLDYEINQRGVHVDEYEVNYALEIVEWEKQRLDLEMQKLTDHQVPSAANAPALTKWLERHGITSSVAKADINTLLSRKDLTPKVRQALTLRQESAKSSTAKLVTMQDGLMSDMRIRGLFQYSAASTRRWAGRRVQLQNLPRPELKQQDIEAVFKIVSTKEKEEAADYIRAFYGSPTTALSDCLRGFIKAPWKKRFIAADFNAIEARVLAWLAGEEKVLNTFRNDEDIYKVAAADIFNVTVEQVTKEQRQIGKVAVLALGYQGGVNAFQSMAKNYGVKVGDERANLIKEAWRIKNQKIVKWWFELEANAIRAVQNPTKPYSVGNIVFAMEGEHLTCTLPSKGKLYYPYAKMKLAKFDWGDKFGLSYQGTDVSGKLADQLTYGGKLAENVTQAVARDLLADAMLRLDDKGYDIVLHVHDEIVCEGGEYWGSVEEVEKIMCELPAWANELPLKAEGWIDGRFRK